MHSVGRRLLLWCALPLSFAAGHAQTLLGEFALQGNLNNNVSGGASLVSLGGQITTLGYVFAANQGLTFTSSALNTGSYTIELSFKFDATSGWRKIIDFTDVVSTNNNDVGLYNLNGALQLYPQSAASVTDFTNGGTVDVVLTRDSATGTLTGYVNGQQRFSFNDSTTNYGLVTATNKTLTFFVDDFHTGQAEASSGTANYIRIYNGALTSTQVSALYAAGAPIAVPEPTTAVLLALGAAGVLLLRQRVRQA